MRFLVPLFCFFAAFQAQVALAATLYIDPNTASLFRGDAVTLSVRLDTDELSGECVNAIDGVITYDSSITAADITIGKSIIPIWVEYPTINKEKRTITFAGGIPNGYCGRVQGDPNLTNTIVDIIFRAPGLQVGGGETRGSAKIAFAPETTVYLNDGLGTKANLRTLGAELTLSDNTGPEIVDPWSGVVADDTIAPEAFSVSLEKGETAFEGHYYIVFNTTDKQTGISHYEVIEESVAQSKLFSFGAVNSPWITARSPYVIKDQSLQSVIRVKAIDKAGNEYIASLIPDPSLQNQTSWYIFGAALLGFVILLLAILATVLLRRRAKSSAVTIVPSETI